MTRVPVVGIGASAGGLEAFSELLSHLPAHSGVAFVFVQHLDPNHESLLGGLLAKRTPMPVVQVGKRARVEANHVYVLAPARSLTLCDEELQTSRLRRSAGGASAIDHFFKSLAKQRGQSAVGVLLSGSGHDGVGGLLAIQAAGGKTLCQSPHTAQTAAMPEAAIAAGAADIVRDLPELASELVRIALVLAGAGVSSANQEARETSETEGLTSILAALRRSTGLDFSTYKPSTLQRRLSRRRVLGKFDSTASYVSHLLRDPHEAAALAEDLLIHVTSFFRDPDMFVALKRKVLPRLLRAHDTSAPLRIWVPGCATGEEVYSLAIATLEFLEGAASRPAIQLFGTDISEATIAKARRGVYPASIRARVGAERLRKYFRKVDDGYQIADTVRASCVFACHDVTSDPPLSRIALISCRNVLIYHTAEAQQRTLAMFHYALLPHGVLVLGGSEGAGARPDMFEALDARQRLFVKKTTRGVPSLRLAPSEHRVPAVEDVAPSHEEASVAVLACKEADRVLLTKFAPASVLLDPELQILQFRGQPGPYIRPLSGVASLSLWKMVHAALAPDLFQALRPRKGPIQPTRGDVRFDVDGEPFEVTFEVVPIRAGKSKGGRGHVLVVFREARQGPVGAPGAVGPAQERSTTARLRRDLAAASEHLQSVIAEHEEASDALRAAVGLGQSTNEELQSTNEELETAKEELQSTNEELGTVNDELQVRNLELNQLNNDLVHVLASIDIPILTLDGAARVRRFNPAAERVLKLFPGDVGRPLTEIRTSLLGVDLAKIVAKAMSGGRPEDYTVVSQTGDEHTLRALPYPPGAARVDGVILTLTPNAAPADVQAGPRSSRRGKPQRADAKTSSGRGARKAKK